MLEVLLHKGPLRVNTIGPKVWLAPGSISVAVDRLEKKALMKLRNTDDRRVRLVELTAKGLALITKTFREHATAMDSLFFSVHPFANIWCAVLERHAVRFAMHEKTHYLAIDHTDVFEI